MACASQNDQERELQELRRQLAEAQETIRAIQGGEVDAVVVSDVDHPTVFTLDSIERPYRLMVEQIHQGAATLSVGGTILFCNEAFSHLMRQTSGDLIGRELRDFIDPHYLPSFELLLQDSLATPVEGETILVRGDGTPIPLFLGISAMREGAAGVCLVVVDLTDRMRRERLVADEALARSILEQVADAVVVCDETGLVVRASRAAHALCGSNPLVRPFREVFSLERASTSRSNDESAPLDSPLQDVDADISAAWRGETIRGLEVAFQRSDGEQFLLLLSAGPLIAAGGDNLGVVLTLTDITRLRRVEKELRQQAYELQEADRRKDEFLAMLAHELRNPLSPIRSSLEIMHLRDIDDPQVRKSREMIGRQVLQLTRLVDDLLEVSRISTGKIQLKRESVELTAAVSQAVDASRSVIDSKKHTLSLTLPGEKIFVKADPTRLFQILGNILHNAAKYTEDSGVVQVRVHRHADEAVIDIQDSGLGIPPEMLGSVFDLFTQVDRSIDRSQGGLGIGLALVKRLVALHGGSVSARSEGIGHGTTFTVRLPIDASIQSSAPETKRQRRRTTISRRVLIVDDNRDAIESLSALLIILGHEVRTASNGPSALAIADTFQPEVVLCDIGLPEMDGYQVVRRMTSNPDMVQTRFVALTGYGRKEDIARSQAAGFHAHLVKPFDLDKLEKIFAHL